MPDSKLLKPDYVFETSWEVCNKVGGIYTVISTKAPGMVKELGDNYILIGPDVWKETHFNPEFHEDRFLFRSWREKAAQEGLRIKVGRWNIEGNPVAILVEFTQYFEEKDKILAGFWEKYGLDSLTGGWDYIEPAIFGYAAARVIESFYQYNIAAHENLITHFHEWMTGAGILYLKEKVPQAATLFTTHATVVGRCIAGNNLPLYSEMEKYKAEQFAREMGVMAKYSLEKISAVQADCFTTVSELTNNECINFLEKKADIITPNGFDDSFVPPAETFDEKRQQARKKLIDVCQALFNQALPENTQFVINSGRYEFRNKGIDLFVESISRLNQSPLNRPVIGLITVPAGHAGPRKELLERLANGPDFNNPLSDEFLTHSLHEPEYDPILNLANKLNIHNRPEDMAKIVFVPVYLNGNDGIFNLPYYDLLIGCDTSVFPSYYEPWGYTPLESLAFHIPTITTTLAGFGLWVQSKYPDVRNGVGVIYRTDYNEADAVKSIVDALLTCNRKSPEEIQAARDKAFHISRIALWENLLIHYKQAFHIAITKTQQRSHLFADKILPEMGSDVKRMSREKPVWKKVLVKPAIPSGLKNLQRLTKNLWWTWNYDVQELFSMVYPELLAKFENNIYHLLESLTIEQLLALEMNEAFMKKLDEVYARFDAYMKEEKKNPERLIAYFSMEYGLHDSVKIYSGGLGMLAGDYLKEASDRNENMVGIGLLYRFGYFKQRIGINGDQEAELVAQKFSHVPIKPVRNEEGDWIKVSIALPGRAVHAKIWEASVGRIPLYLLDTDIEDNQEQDRTITHQLYGGDWENRFKQELLLGVGGIRLLDALNIKPDLYHCNEGHAAFIGLERLRKYVQDEKLTFHQALEIVRSSQLFTTHTPVPAGHDAFSENILRTYIPHYAQRLNISWETFMGLGRENEDNHEEKFSMSVLAAKLSQEMNGVSKIHGRVTQDMFNSMFHGYFPRELHIDYVTNGVHLCTWVAKRWLDLYQKELGKNFLEYHGNPEVWKKIYDVSDDKIWEIRTMQRHDMIKTLRERLSQELTRRQENPKMILRTMENLNDKALTIGFARRFATYKRAHLLFTNLERLANIVNNAQKPVHFVFAGKAHPQDKAGQDLIKRIIEVSRLPEFLGKITFVENYDIDLAKTLVRGVDVWLNTPTRPLEASGTSGQKAVMNGVLNLSVLDGWWAEGYIPGAGWALTDTQAYSNQKLQDELDAETIYSLLEEEVIPMFYNRNEKGIPRQWVSYIKKNIAEIAPQFTTRRMWDDYEFKFYSKLWERTKLIRANDYQAAKQLANWKRKVLRGWDSIELISADFPDSTNRPLKLGENFIAEIVLNLSGLSCEDIGVEVVFANKQNEQVIDYFYIEEMKAQPNGKGTVKFTCDIPASRAGVFDYAFRIFPKHPLLPHRQDFNLVKWV